MSNMFLRIDFLLFAATLRYAAGKGLRITALERMRYSMRCLAR